MLFTAFHQRGDQHFCAVIDALDLELHERVSALAQRLGGADALFFHLRLHLAAQHRVTDADETPRLHQADTGRLMRRFQQARQQLGRNRSAAEMAHVTALGDGAVHGSPFFSAEGVFGHGLNNAAIACGQDGK